MLDRITTQAARLGLGDLKRLDTIIHRLISVKEDEREDAPFSKLGREVVKVKRHGSVTYQNELVRCGKEKCRCAKGRGHGPYWYAYWSQSGKTKSKYIGKELSRDRKKETQSERDGGE